MQKRTEAEIEAYVGGYNDCYKQLCQYAKGKYDINQIMDKMYILCNAVNALVEKEGDGCCEPKGY